MSAEVLRYAAFTDSEESRTGGIGGNPAGVVLDASRLDDQQMHAIAAALGYSETAFVTSSETSGTHRLRFFSPRAEVGFCGHATIATAVAIAERSGPDILEFATAAGPVLVTTASHDGHTTATLTSPPSHTRPVDGGVLSAALSALRWSRRDVHPGYPPHVGHAGNDHLLLAAATWARLADFDYDFAALGELMGEQGWTTVCVVHPGASPDAFSVRNAFPPGGVVEDPATGAAAAAFGGYLRDLRLVPLPARLVLRQGQHLGSPSRLVVDVDPGVCTVRVTGTATRLPLSRYDEPDLL